MQFKHIAMRAKMAGVALYNSDLEQQGLFPTRFDFVSRQASMEVLDD